MKALQLIALLAAMAVAACEDSSNYVASDQAGMADFEASAIEASRDGSSGQLSPEGEREASADTERLMAYRHEMTLRLPPTELIAAHDAHIEACRNAGPQMCQILSDRVSGMDTDFVSADISLRATPEWMSDFRASIVTDAQAVGGRLARSQTVAEDLTVQIVDVEARLQAQIALRDRLMELLQTRDAELSELVALERQLASVQSELDARSSVLARLRQRVDMSVLSIAYQSTSRFDDRGQNPVQDALSDAGETFLASLGALIAFVIGVGPWMIVILPALWFGVRFIGRAWRSRKAKP